MEAVTTRCREWRCAARAPARSIQCIKRPPTNAFRGLASFGMTISAISEIDSRTGRGISFVLSSFINCEMRRTTLSCAIRLQVAVCESEHTRVGKCVEPDFAHQIKSQFPVFDR